MGKRLHTLKSVKALRESQGSWDEIEELLGISRATYYRWEKAWKEKGLAGPKIAPSGLTQPRSRRPRRVRGKVQWKPELLVRMEGLRKENPTWGRWPIGPVLGREGFPVGERTVGRILAYWEGRGRVERVASYLARRGGGKARGRPRRPYARRKPRGYKVLAPGDLSKIAPSGLTQVDTLTVTLGPGEVVKHFTAVDLCTRYALGEVHRQATARLAGEFLCRLVAQVPFPIRGIQVDGGSEFMAELGKTCQGLGIALFLLPPRSPKLNGHVEQLQRTFREEFYTRPLPTRLSELQAKLDAYLDPYNRRRPHMALGGLAPLEFLAKIQEGSVPQGASNVVANHTPLTVLFWSGSFFFALPAGAAGDLESWGGGIGSEGLMAL